MKLFSKDRAVKLIENSVRTDRLSNAYIICGEKGVGKKTLAKYMASQILCEKKQGIPCGECKPCRMLNASAHPDFITVTPAGKSGNYLSDDLRPIISDASISPNEGDKKIYFLPQIDRALTAAQNVLLKIIEEPPAHVAFIMTADRKDMILPTVLSRSICLNIPEPSEDECLEALREKGVDIAVAKNAVSVFGGNIGKCLEYINDDGAKRLPEAVSKICSALVESDEYALLCALSSLEKERELCLETLAALKNVIRDAVCEQTDAKMCSLCRDGAKRLAEKYRKSSLGKMFEDISSAEALISGNGSSQLVLADLCGKLSASR